MCQDQRQNNTPLLEWLLGQEAKRDLFRSFGTIGTGFPSDIEQDIIPLAPIVQQSELGIPVEDVLKAPAL